MSYNIGNNPTTLTAAASGDLLKVHDISADSEKNITAADLVGSNGTAVENFAITTTTGVAYTIEETAGRDVALFVTETNDEAHTITFPALAVLRDGQRITISYAAALTANATFAKGGAGAISGAHGAAVTQYQTFLYIYDATGDIWFGSTLAIT